MFLMEFPLNEKKRNISKKQNLECEIPLRLATHRGLMSMCSHTNPDGDSVSRAPSHQNSRNFLTFFFAFKKRKKGHVIPVEK
jgi:hypothetical protein